MEQLQIAKIKTMHLSVSNCEPPGEFKYQFSILDM